MDTSEFTRWKALYVVEAKERELEADKARRRGMRR